MRLLHFFVVHLYTVIFVKEAPYEAVEKLYSGIFSMPSFDKQTFIIHTELGTTNVVMLTDDGLYHHG